MKVIIKELPEGGMHPTAEGFQSDITHMIYIMDEASERPIKAGVAKSLAEAQQIQKEFEEKVASLY